MNIGDVIYFAKGKKRHGPFRCRFDNPLRLFNDSLTFSEGDKIIRVFPGGSEMAYTIVHVSFSAGIRTLRPHFVYTHQEDSSFIGKIGE